MVLGFLFCLFNAFNTLDALRVLFFETQSVKGISRVSLAPRAHRLGVGDPFDLVYVKHLPVKHPGASAAERGGHYFHPAFSQLSKE